MDIPILFVCFSHFYQHGFEARFDGAVCSFDNAIGLLVKVGYENDFDVQSLL